MLHLVTGHKGSGHITAADMGALNAGMCGTGQYILRIGNQFAANIISNNLIEILDGELIDQGRHIRLPPGEFERVSIENGRAGVKRRDIIAIRYQRDTSTGVESASFWVCKGKEISLNADYNTSNGTRIDGDILGGENIDDIDLYHVDIQELAIQRITKAPSVLPPLAHILEYVYPVGCIYQSTKPTSPATLFGGTWQQIEDRFLFSAGKRAAGSRGGQESIQLTGVELPEHKHNIMEHTHKAVIGTDGEHLHTMGIRTDGVKGGTAERIGNYSITTKTHQTHKSGAHSHTVKIEGTSLQTLESGLGKPFSSLPPYLVVYMWQRTA